MALLRKYLFGTRATATKYINALGVDENGNPTHQHKVVDMGPVVESVDDEGNVTMSKKIAVDVVWHDQPASGWSRYIVWPVNFQHTMGGSAIQIEYGKALMKERPELFKVEDETLDNV